MQVALHTGVEGGIPPEVYLFITVLKLLADRHVLSSGQLRYYIMNQLMGQFSIQQRTSIEKNKTKRINYIELRHTENKAFDEVSFFLNHQRCKYDKILFYITSCTVFLAGGTVILNGRKGVLQSLGYPNAYPPHLNSSWKITVAKGFLVKFQITDLAITGQTGQCKEDKLIISDVYSTLGEPYLNTPRTDKPDTDLDVAFCF